MKQPPPQQLLDARGRTIIERRGMRKRSFATDAFHFMRTASWTRINVLFAVVYLATNLIFAAIYWAGDARITSSHGFLDDFWFSVQTLATIGYGYLSPTNNFGEAIVTIESFVGILLVALITGVVFARFSTPSARVLFSKIALITNFDGKRVMMFRIANERATAIVEATVRVYMTRDETLASGEVFRRVYDIPVRRNTSPVFALTFLVVHDIDEKSPLYNVTADGLASSATNLIVTFTGIDDVLATTVHSRYLWSPGDVHFDRRYIDLFKRDPNGRRYLDLSGFHDDEELQPS